jgi:hypothetical protein
MAATKPVQAVFARAAVFTEPHPPRGPDVPIGIASTPAGLGILSALYGTRFVMTFPGP